ncbi:MAG TPA: hypothetical protein VM260_13040 [Pirellula sp.]|nr:hypothetical protein [Pirellula sp.]
MLLVQSRKLQITPVPNTGLTWIFYALESVVMDWRINQSESRARYLAKYNTDEVELYESWIRQLTRDDDLACLRDIQNAFTFRGGMSVLDVGAGHCSRWALRSFVMDWEMGRRS